jgi:DNA-binding beta-propeller fold protein YncE
VFTWPAQGFRAREAVFMTPRRASRSGIGILLILLFVVAAGFAQPFSSEALPQPSVSLCSSLNGPIRAYPIVELGCGWRIQFLGTYGDDGVFHEPSNLIALRNRDAIRTPSSELRPAEVPRFIRLNPLEHVVENYSLSYHARKRVGGHRRLASILDGLVTFAYGRERALLRPQYLTTDSAGRVIVSDPEANAVHVLDGERSFRIAGGPHRLLLKPAGVAVDAEDKIYVADSVRGLVEVYTPQGQFIRFIGRIDDESLFELPAGIAIDRAKGRLYVLDFLRDRLFVMDLNGRILERVGLHRSPDAVEFDHPTSIALAGNGVAVLDSAASRIQILGPDFKLRKSFEIGLNQHSYAPKAFGFAADREGNVFVNDLRDSFLRVYGPDGKPLHTIGKRGGFEGEFEGPQGLWIEGTGKIYVADSGNRRIQVFQLQRQEGASLPLAVAVDSDN